MKDANGNQIRCAVCKEVLNQPNKMYKFWLDGTPIAYYHKLCLRFVPEEIKKPYNGETYHRDRKKSED